MKTAFRVDASAHLGLGHLKRCISLADELVELGGEVLFVSQDLGVDIAVVAGTTASKMAVLSIGECSDWRADANGTVQALRDSGAQWVVVDHYGLDAEWHRSVIDALGARVAVIDDLGNRNLCADLLIDHNLNSGGAARKYSNCLSKNTKILGGPRFALIGRAFRSSRGYEFNKSVRTIGIFMGGTDAINMSTTVLRACREVARFEGPIEIATTRYNPNLARLRGLADADPKTSIVEDLPDLADFFSRHDLQIGAGGGASLERAALGAPSLVLVVAENQRPGVFELAKGGAVHALDPDKDANPLTIGLAVAELLTDGAYRNRLHIRSKQLVDGFGARRVGLYMLSDEVNVRVAQVSDAEMILRWRNHQSVRLVSRDPSVVKPDVHLTWMKGVLADCNRCLLVGRVGETNIGVIRFDKQMPSRIEVSLYLDPIFLGLGLGTSLLRAGEQYMRSMWSGEDTRLVATVLDGNEPSRKLFASCGYSFVADHWEKHFGPTATEWRPEC
jgi:UDP-2,4-diacetamido-2,4,6-trideoxy-beta-L-altropyranose hydrolase